MNNYIKVYDNVLSKSQCKTIINNFENNPGQHVHTYLEDHRSFMEVNLNQNPFVWNNTLNLLIGASQQYLKQYKKDCAIDDNIWPERFGYEQLRMKRYLPNGKDEFKFHVDVTDHNSARRFLVYFWYLNDVTEGGETAFLDNRNTEPYLKVQPKTGRLLMFPPMWTYPHVAYAPISGSKYIIGGYLHYL